MSARSDQRAAARRGALPEALDARSRRWVQELHCGHPRRDRAVQELHDLLHRVAIHELYRRRAQLAAIRGPEFEDLAQQAADDAVIKILQRLDDFCGLSRFTTWAYKFVIFEVSGTIARHSWRRRPPEIEIAWDHLPDQAARRPEDSLEQRAQLRALRQAIGTLTSRQREVFVAIALNDAPVDLVAAKLDTNRNAVYKNLFDARRSLREKMAASGFPVGDARTDDIEAPRGVAPATAA